MSGDLTNGAGNLIRTALDAGIEVCFAKPGTTVMRLVDAHDARPGAARKPLLLVFPSPSSLDGR